MSLSRGTEHFACQDSSVSQIYNLIISNGGKILSNVKAEVTRHVKRENSSLFKSHASKSGEKTYSGTSVNY